MHKNLLLVLAFVTGFLMAGQPGLSQTTAPINTSFCGTASLPPAQALALVKLAKQARQQQMAQENPMPAITYVPIRPHIIRRSNGTGGYNMANMNQVMALTNSYYLLNGLGIQFYFAGSSPDYIDNDAMYNSYSGQPVDAYDAHNAMNQYYVNAFSTSGLGGFAYFPANDIVSTRSFILDEHNDDDMGNRLVPHELGHNFGLIHTFGGSNGEQVTTELVARGAGANCTTDGDLLCDTPADPYGKSGTSLIFPNGCVQYDPNSSARDANGAPYSPSITNIMSYYFPCTHDFTPGQLDRVQDALALRQTHTAYTLTALPTAVTAPGNLTGSTNNSAITLTWQDNATNEMGYFVERSTVSNTGFLPIGGVAPNTNTFTDSKAVPHTQYYYRIRSSNATTGSLSNTATLRVETPITGLTTTNITGNTAQLNWNSAGAGITYTVQYRAVAGGNWNTTTNYSGVSITAYVQANMAYEWQVKVTGDDTYSGPVSFTTTCPAPTFLSVSPYRTSASLFWSGANPQTYTVEWRPQNTPTWTAINDILYQNYTLTGLTASTPYEWRVQATCPGSMSVATVFSPAQSFTTAACPVPTLNQLGYSSTTVALAWSTNFGEPGRTFSLRYRVIGTTDWTTISVIPTQDNSGYTSYSLTGLTPNTSYEIQVESICSPTEHSGFSSSITVTPACQAPTSLNATAYASTAALSWIPPYVRDPGTTFDLQYRVVGSATWSTVTIASTVSPPASVVYSLTGLAASSTYEWRVRTNCPASIYSDYTTGSNFATSCTAPNNAFLKSVSTTSAVLTWSAIVESGSRFEVRYRVVGAANWSTTGNLSLTAVFSVFTYNLTGLTNTMQYEWQVRTVCSDTDQSAYVNGSNFTTTCQIPDNLTSYAQTTSARLTWAPTGAPGYEVRYRRLGTPDWITVTNLTTYTVTITNLIPNAGYEWQVRSLCDGGVSSNFSASTQFGTPYCYYPGLSFDGQGATSVKVILSYANGGVGTTYEVRYRVVGTTDWTTISSLTATSVVITNLTPDSPYEFQVKSICTATDSSPFSPSALFQTCSVYYTVQVGSWDKPYIWACNQIPGSGDTVQIKHQVTVPANYTAKAGTIRFDAKQRLIFVGNAKLKMGGQ